MMCEYLSVEIKFLDMCSLSQKVGPLLGRQYSIILQTHSTIYPCCRVQETHMSVSSALRLILLLVWYYGNGDIFQGAS